MYLKDRAPVTAPFSQTAPFVPLFVSLHTIKAPESLRYQGFPGGGISPISCIFYFVQIMTKDAETLVFKGFAGCQGFL